jgi:di/tricarboxylate transporter
LAWGILRDNGIYLSWIQWFLYMLFPVLSGVTIMFIGYWLMFKPEPAQLKQQEAEDSAGKIADVKEIARKEIEKMGPMKTSEKKMAIILIGAVLLWCTEKLHGIDSDLIGIAMGAVVCLPVIGVLDAKEAFRKINWKYRFCCRCSLYRTGH